MFRPNSLFYTDGYKIGHRKMLAPGTTKLYGTWIPRSIKYAPKGITKVVSFGQQLVVRWLHDEWQENFFALPKYLSPVNQHIQFHPVRLGYPQIPSLFVQQCSRLLFPDQW